MSQPASQNRIFFVSGGTLKPTAPSYVERAADQEFFDRLLAGDFCYVLTSRQMGKSSLMARTAVKLRAAGAQTAIIDLTNIGEGAKGKESAATWYFGIASDIADELKLEADLNQWWQDHAGLPEQQRFRKFLEELVLGATTQRIVIFVDEIDATLRLPFTDDFFAGIRACYNARASKPAFERLTFALLGVASPDELIKDTSRTPFNIGHRIELPDFTLEEAQPLTAGFPLPPEEAARALERVLHWTGGQPYLTQRLCLELTRRLGSGTTSEPRSSRREEAPTSSSGIRHPASARDQSLLTSAPTDALTQGVDDLVRELFFASEASRSEVHFKYIRDRLRQDPHARRVLLTYRRVLRGKRVPDNPQSLLHNALKLAGLVQRTSDGNLRVRNPIYQRVFDLKWVRQVLAAEVGLRRGFACAIIAVLLVAGLAKSWWNRDNEKEDLVTACVDALLIASPEQVPIALENLRSLRDRALPKLQTEFVTISNNSPRKLNAAFGLAAFGEVRVNFLYDSSAAEMPPSQWVNLIRALARQKELVMAKLPQRIAKAEVPEARVWLATLALFRGDTAPAQQLTQRSPNPTNRTTFVHGYRHWPGEPSELAAILQTASTNAELSDFRSAICAALALVEWRSLAAPDQAALVKTLRQLYTDAPDGGTHSAAACALTRWGQALPKLSAPTNQPPADRDWFVNRQGMTMIRIPAGTFRMGDQQDIISNAPLHQVTLSNSFFISDREVTVAQFRQFMNQVASDPTIPPLERLTDWVGEAAQFSPAVNRPVQQVNWFDAVKFCNWLSRQEGRTPCYRATSPTNWQCNLQANGYRLPTEAEWEYACRAASQSRYTFGDDEKLLGEYAWCYANSPNRTWPAGSKLPNLWGAFDLHGNLWEWCQDWYGPYRSEPITNPPGPESGDYRGLRGGSWGGSGPAFLSSLYRNFVRPDYRLDYIGFRCVLGVVGSAPR